MAGLVFSVRDPVAGATVGPNVAFVRRDGLGVHLFPFLIVRGRVVFGDGGPQQQAPTIAGGWRCVSWPLPALAAGLLLETTAMTSGMMTEDVMSNLAEPGDGLEEPFDPLAMVVRPDGDVPETCLSVSAVGGQTSLAFLVCFERKRRVA